jgi:hypothetical protein
LKDKKAAKMKKIIAVACLAVILGSCYNDKADKLYPAPVTTCDTTTISYSHDIAPIVIASCYSPGNGCHDAAGAATSGFDYQSSVTAIQSNALSGTLLGDINWLPRHNNMPKNGSKLSDCEINKMTRWVNEGAPNN